MQSPALHIKSLGSSSLVYLFAIDKAAVFKRKEFAAKVYIGDWFLCEYSEYNKTDESPETDGISFEVTKILEFHKCPQERYIEQEECYLVLECNFSETISRFDDRSETTGGRYVLRSPDVGKVLLLHEVLIIGKVLTANEIVSQFEKKPPAEKMMCCCRFTKCRVPRGMVDDGFEGAEEIDAYVWMIMDIDSSREFYEDAQKEKARDNVRKEIQEIERMERRNSELKKIPDPSQAPSQNENHSDELTPIHELMYELYQCVNCFVQNEEIAAKMKKYSPEEFETLLEALDKCKM